MPIVAAVMSAVNASSLGDGEGARQLRQILIDAEVRAVEECLAEGHSVYDAEVIKARKAVYRQRALDAFYG